jgi:murein DD-endopeptidase MepM/ murein hydrolase activator NlpD
MMEIPYKGICRLTTPFGKKGGWACGWHIGIDLVGVGNKTIYPITAGTVIRVGDGGAYGNHVRIRHTDGNLSLYAHLSKISVKTGQTVSVNTPIGIEGTSGNSAGSHLHLEIHHGDYKYPPTGSNPSVCDWLINPAEALCIMNEVGVVKVTAGATAKKQIKLKINDVVLTVTSIENDGNNYIKLQDLRHEKIEVGYDSAAKMPIIKIK